MGDSLRTAAVRSSSRVGEGEAFADEVTDPGPLPKTYGAPQRQDDLTQKLAAAAVGRKRNRVSSYWIGRRAVLLLFAGVATLLVGFGTMTAVLGLSAWLAQSDAKPVPTTAASVAPPSSAVPPVTPPPSSAPLGPSVQSELPPPTLAPPAPAPATAPAPEPPPASAPYLNPAGKAPPGRNK